MKHRENKIAAQRKEPVNKPSANKKHPDNSLVLEDNRHQPIIQKKWPGEGIQMKSNVKINDDTRLEKEADKMGNVAMQNIHNNDQPSTAKLSGLKSDIVQRVVTEKDANPGDRVTDKSGEEFILIRWSHSNKDWEVERVDTTTGKEKYTYRSC